uniref:Uncharacterized protein n=1 Tax=Aegilops tauschii subsp. strangulata TaxID=200361 RepID=A0A453B6H1_AEGTS
VMRYTWPNDCVLVAPASLRARRYKGLSNLDCCTARSSPRPSKRVLRHFANALKFSLGRARCYIGSRAEQSCSTLPQETQLLSCTVTERQGTTAL